MLDLDKLEGEREAASRDKADLFDFYHDNWGELISEIKRHRKETETTITIDGIERYSKFPHYPVV